PSGLHQVEYYQQLVHALDCPNGPIEPRLPVPPHARESAERLLQDAGWRNDQQIVQPLVAIAPGAAYGGAKRWPPASLAALAADLARDGVRTVIVGSAADRATADEVASGFSRTSDVVSGCSRTSDLALIDLVGRTDLATLAGVLASCRALVTN